MALIALVGAVALLAATPASAIHTKNPSFRNQGVDLTGAQWYNSDFTNEPAYYGFDPMEASAPYLAWRGEEVRLVKCISQAREGDSGDPKPSDFSQDAEFQIMDWSGDEHVWPKFFDDSDGTVSRFDGEGDQDGRRCWAIDITSHKAGIAIVKMKVEGSESFNRTTEHVRGDGGPVMAHQFTVIWMNLGRAILRNLEGGDGPAGGPIVVDAPSSEPENRLGVLVKGTVPLNLEFRTDYNLPETILLPDAWVALSNTSLGHIAHTLQLANDGIEGNDDFENPTCTASPDQGDNEDFDPNACDNDRGEDYYIPEPEHAPGAFWDIHDSTGPFNSGVYATPPLPNQPMTDAGFCEGEESPKPDPDCHVEQVIFTEAGADPCDPDKALTTADQVTGTGANTPDTNDTVDNCFDGAWGPFSRVFHDLSSDTNGTSEPTIGPYSPTRPDETLLSDSRLTLNDAPMPAALVLPEILDDPADPTDAVGSIGVGANSVAKELVYNRGTFGQEECLESEGGHPLNQHCVNAPFTGAYIPPSPTMETETADNVPDLAEVPPGREVDLDDDRDTASGIHGPFANNFAGYLPVCYPQGGDWPIHGHANCDQPNLDNIQNDGLYHYWDSVDVLGERIATDTDCVLFDPNGPGVPPGPEFGQTPSGPDKVALYTDEHGEAQFNFIPGLGFFFDELVDPNAAGGCDLEGLEDLGSATIVVNARYPFEPVTHAGITSNELTKEIKNEFEKRLVCQPKPGASLFTVCYVQITDPFAPASQIVCFVAPGRVLSRFLGTKDGIDFSDTGLAPPTDNALEDEPNADFLCIRTDDKGFGAVEFITLGLPVTVTAMFIEEPNIARQCTITAPTGRCDTRLPITVTAASVPPAILSQIRPPVPIVTPAGVAVQAGGSNAGNPTINPANQQPLKTSVLRQTAAKKKASLVFVRIVRPLKQGAFRSVLLRVKSSKGTARVQLKLIGLRGKVLGTVLRTVKTNRTVMVPKLRLPKAATNVRVKVIA